MRRQRMPAKFRFEAGADYPMFRLLLVAGVCRPVWRHVGLRLGAVAEMIAALDPFRLHVPGDIG